MLKHVGGRLHAVSGRWIVFDKGQSNPLPLFEAETCEECYKFIRKREGAAK